MIEPARLVVARSVALPVRQPIALAARSALLLVAINPIEVAALVIAGRVAKPVTDPVFGAKFTIAVRPRGARSSGRPGAGRPSRVDPHLCLRAVVVIGELLKDAVTVDALLDNVHAWGDVSGVDELAIERGVISVRPAHR